MAGRISRVLNQGCEWRMNFDGAAEVARYHDFAGLKRLVFGQRQAAASLHVIAQAPFAVHPGAAPHGEVRGELPIAVPVLIVHRSKAESQDELGGKASQGEDSEARRANGLKLHDARIATGAAMGSR